METKLQIKSIFGKVIFEYEKENNTIKDTLEEAIKQNANLYNANLYNANLEYANLKNANLYNANLEYANLKNANLYNANLYNANLEHANLKNAYLENAYLEKNNINKLKHLFQIIPMEGSFVAWKKLANNCLAKIEIPAKSPRTFSLIGRKCRAKYVKTLKIWDENGNEIKEMHGGYNNSIIYKINRLTHADEFDNNMLIECTHGIHFFISKQEALNWK